MMNGDILTDLNYKEFFETHQSYKSDVTIASYSKNVKIDLGVMKTKEMNLVDYVEKPTLVYQVSMGIYGFNIRAIDLIPKDEYYDFPTLIKELLAHNRPVKIYTQPNCTWLDLGRLEDFQSSLDIFQENIKKFLPDLS